jgi:hypothetical protein
MFDVGSALIITLNETCVPEVGGMRLTSLAVEWYDVADTIRNLGTIIGG